MLLQRLLSSVLLILSTSICFDVGTSYAEPDTKPSVPLGDAQKAKVLASIEMENGHIVVFREFARGGLIVTETAKIFQTPLLGHAVFGKSMAEIHQLIRPKDKVPDSLIAADTQLSNLKSKPAPVRVPAPSQVPGTGRGPRLYNAGEQDWFKQTFCHDSGDPLSLLECIQGWDWITSGWQRGAIFATESFVGSEGVTANLRVYYWNGSSEVQLAADSVAPGQYVWHYINYYQPFWLHLDLAGAGDSTQVSQDIRTCGNGGQWACSRNCEGTISCNPENTTYCSIVGASGQSWCNNR